MSWRRYIMVFTGVGTGSLADFAYGYGVYYKEPNMLRYEVGFVTFVPWGLAVTQCTILLMALT